MQKAQRIKLYKQAIEDFTNKVYGTNQGLCIYFSFLLGIPTFNVMKELPELAKQEPKDRDSSFWWPIDYREHRIQALQQALKLAQKK